MIYILRLIFYILLIYLLLFIVRIILSFLKINYSNYNKWLCKITDPVINFFKKILPIQIGIYELSALIPVIILYLILKFLSDIINSSILLSFYYLIYFIFFIIKIIFISTSFTLSFFLIVLLITGSRYEYAGNPFVSFAKKITAPILAFLKKLINYKLFKSDTGYYLLLLAFVFIMSLIINGVLNYFTSYFYESAIRYSINIKE